MVVKKVRLDVCSMCQLSCPLCPTGTGIIKQMDVGWGYLKFQNFKWFVDNNPYIKEISIANKGEIFLNPDLRDILRYAYENNVRLTADSGVNLNNATE